MKKLLLFVVLFFVIKTQATHIVGGDITVQHTTGNNFNIKLNMYKDCSPGAAQFQPSLEIGLFDKVTHVLVDSFNLNLLSVNPLTLGDECYAPNLCVEEGIYTATVAIQNNPNGYYLSYQRCCRNSIIQNIVSPGSAGLVYYTEIPDPAIANSTPVIGSYTKAYMCAGIPNTLNLSATDVDGDVLIYSLETPLNGNNPPSNNNPATPIAGPYATITWQPPYSLFNIIGSSPNLTINLNTGIINVTPTTLGTFVIAVKVEEFRNGLKIGEIRRDIQIQIVNCINPLNPGPNATITCSNSIVQVTANSSVNMNYNWSGPGIVSGGNTSSASVNTAGTYTVTATTTTGCTYTTTVMVTDNIINPDISTSAPITITCTNISGSINASSTTSGAIFSWSGPGVGTGISSPTITVTAGGTYTVTVTDPTNGCTVTAAVNVTANTSQPNISIISSPTLDCNTTSGTIQSSSTTNGVIYSWVGPGIVSGGNTNAPLINASGTYTVTVTNPANGCTNTAVAIVNLITSMTTTTTSKNVLCYGGNNGSAIIIVSGGAGNYNYSWNSNPVQTTSNASNLSAGTYTCVVTDGNGCTATNTVTITQPSVLNANINTISNITCNALCNGSATVSVSGGTANYSYSWGTNPIVTSATATGLCAGNYTVVVSDDNGCTASASTTITQPNPISAYIVNTNSTCNGSNNASATITVNGGTPNYNYLWAPTGGTNATENNLAAGTYTCTVADANGCKVTSTVTITEPSAIVVSINTTNVTCNGRCDGTATAVIVGGGNGFSYTWNTTPVQNTSTISSLCPGTYMVVVTDNSGCTASATSNAITEPLDLVVNPVSVTHVTCHNQANGAANVAAYGGTPAYNFSWSTTPVQATSAVANLAAGAYVCTVTDAKGCTASSTITINQPNAITINSLNTSNVLCYGQCTGTATINVNGGAGNYSYSWNSTPVQNSAIANGLCAGNYTVTITDNNGCTITASASIAQPVAAVSAANSIITNAACNGSSNGSASIIASGGTSPYSYSWNTAPAQNGNTIANLSAGSYTCMVTDNNGCTVTHTITITEPAPIVVTTGNIDITCKNLNSATVAVAGGAMPYTYLWNVSPVQTTQTITNVPAGMYTVVVTDANGCTQIHTVTIVNNLVTPTPGFTISPTAPPVFTGSILSFDDHSTNGNTWEWDFGDGNSSVLQNPNHSFEQAGEYCIKQTVLNMPSGCKDSVIHCITIEADWTFYVPNAFSPNGDGVNDSFGGKGTNILEYKMLIFDRWGNEIFQSNNIHTTWDGRVRNKGEEVVQQDVYVYTIYLTDIKSKPHKYIGHVTVVK